MSADALKRLIVAVGGLFTAIFFVLTNKELDPVMVQKVVDAVVWIVGLYLAQSGGKAAVREWAVMKREGPPPLVVDTKTMGEVKFNERVAVVRPASGLPLNPNKDTP